MKRIAIIVCFLATAMCVTGCKAKPEGYTLVILDDQGNHTHILQVERHEVVNLAEVAGKEAETYVRCMLVHSGGCSGSRLATYLVPPGGKVQVLSQAWWVGPDSGN